MSVASWCCTCFCVVLCVSFCTGHFVMVPLNSTYLHCLQHPLFEHLFNLYYTHIWLFVMVILCREEIQLPSLVFFKFSNDIIKYITKQKWQIQSLLCPPRKHRYFCNAGNWSIGIKMSETVPNHLSTRSWTHFHEPSCRVRIWRLLTVVFKKEAAKMIHFWSYI